MSFMGEILFEMTLKLYVYVIYSMIENNLNLVKILDVAANLQELT